MWRVGWGAEGERGPGKEEEEGKLNYAYSGIYMPENIYLEFGNRGKKFFAKI